MTQQEENQLGKVYKSQKVRSWIQGIGFPVIVGLVFFFLNKFDGYFAGIDRKFHVQDSINVQRAFKDFEQDGRLDNIDGILNDIDKKYDKGNDGLYTGREVKKIVKDAIQEFRDSLQKDT